MARIPHPHVRVKVPPAQRFTAVIANPAFGFHSRAASAHGHTTPSFTAPAY